MPRLNKFQNVWLLNVLFVTIMFFSMDRLLSLPWLGLLVWALLLAFALSYLRLWKTGTVGDEAREANFHRYAAFVYNFLSAQILFFCIADRLFLRDLTLMGPIISFVLLLVPLAIALQVFRKKIGIEGLKKGFSPLLFRHK